MEQQLSRIRTIFPVCLRYLLIAILAGLATLHFYGPGLFSFLWIGLVLLSLALQATALFSQRLGSLSLLIIGVVALLMHAFSFLDGEPWLSWSRLIHILALLLLAWILRTTPVGRHRPSSEFMLAGLLSLVVFAVGVINGQVLYIAQLQIFLLQFALFTFCVACFPDLVRSSWTYFIFVLLILALMLLSNALAGAMEGVLATSDRAFHMLGHFMFAWTVHAICRQCSWRIIYLLWTVLAGILVCTLAVVLLWFSLDQPRTYNWISRPPLFNNIRHMGYFLSFATTVATFWYFSARLMQRYLAGVALLFGFILLFWNGGRGSALAVMLASVLVLYCSGFSWQRLRSMSCLILLALAISFLFRVDANGMGWVDALWRSDSATSVNALSSGRLWVWSVLWPFIEERLWFGWGGNGFVSVWPEEFNIIQAHNGPIQLLLEWGLITTSFILCMISCVFFRGLSMLKRHGKYIDQSLLLGLMVTVGMMILSLFDGVFYYGTPGSYLVLGLGLISGRVSRVKAG